MTVIWCLIEDLSKAANEELA